MTVFHPTLGLYSYFIYKLTMAKSFKLEIITFYII